MKSEAHISMLKRAEEFCQILKQSGLCPGNHGNLSFKIGDEIIITTTGCSMENPEFCTIDSDHASSDAKLHQEFYRLHPEVDWVAHIHGMVMSDALIVMIVKDHGCWLGLKFPISINHFVFDSSAADLPDATNCALSID